MKHIQNLAQLILTCTIAAGSLAGCVDNSDGNLEQTSSADGGTQPLSELEKDSSVAALPLRAGPRCCTKYIPPPTEAELLANVEEVRTDFLDDSTRAAYFASPITDLSSTPDGGRFVFYEGTAGLGAFYMSPTIPYESPATKTTFVPVYGEILTLWAQQGYERWNGYFTAPEEAPFFCTSDGAQREQHLSDIPAPDLDESLGFDPDRPGHWIYHRTVCWASGRIWLRKDSAFAYDAPSQQ